MAEWINIGGYVNSAWKYSVIAQSSVDVYLNRQTSYNYHIYYYNHPFQLNNVVNLGIL